MKKNILCTVLSGLAVFAFVGEAVAQPQINRSSDDFLRIKELDNVFVYDILEDSYGKLWLATYSDGVFCYTVLLIRFWTHSRREGAFILLSEENKKIRTLLLSEKSSDFVVVVRVVIQNFSKSIVVQFVFEIIG